MADGLKSYLFGEDCRETIARGLPYHYVWTSPPDYAEINLTPIKDDQKYVEFLSSIYSALTPSNGLITSLVTDRKYQGGILPKHKFLTELMLELGYRLLSHKIWIKGTSRSLFRLTYAHLLTFGTGQQLGQKQREKTFDCADFHLDVFFDKQGRDKDGQPASLITRCIRAHTKRNEVVFDPFMGRGSTAIAAVDCGRYFLGSEIDQEKQLETKRSLATSGVEVLTEIA